MDVTLKDISRANFDDVIELELTDAQRGYLPSNVYSIAESTLSETFFPKAIHLGDTAVGFAMYQFAEPGDPYEDECIIWRFMVGLKHQNTGIGKRAMPLLLAEIIAHNRCSLIDIYYAPQNTAARRLYTSFGFKEVGHRDDGDIIAELPVPKRKD